MTSEPDTYGHGSEDPGMSHLSEKAAPDGTRNTTTLHGCVDTSPENAEDDCGDAALDKVADMAYEYAPPDSDQSASRRHDDADSYSASNGANDKGALDRNGRGDAVSDFEYDDARPDSAYDHGKDQYGYGDAAPSLGYGDARPDSAYDHEKDQYGYGDASPDLGYKDKRLGSANDHEKKLYGYGDAMPDLGYGDALPDSARNVESDPYGYGDAAPDLGCEDAAPDSAKNGASDTFGYEDASPNLGHRDARPDSLDNKNDPYGYSDATPDLGYENAVPDDRANLQYGSTTSDQGYGVAEQPDSGVDRYGYGEAAEQSGYDEAIQDQRAALGYGDAALEGGGEYQVGYNDEVGNTVGGRGGGSRRLGPARTRSDESWMSASSAHSVATAESYGEYCQAGAPRRQRYRRRGSVTKYSIESHDTVKQEYEEHANVIDQYRATMHREQHDGGANPSSKDHDVADRPLQQKTVEDEPHREPPSLGISAEDSFDEPTGLPVRATHGNDDSNNVRGSPRRFADGDSKHGRKKGKDGKKLMQRLRRRFSMSS